MEKAAKSSGPKRALTWLGRFKTCGKAEKEEGSNWFSQALSSELIIVNEHEYSLDEEVDSN